MGIARFNPNVVLVAVRLLLAVGVAAAMPVAHVGWGNRAEAAGTG